jgi:hypothetical protein
VLAGRGWWRAIFVLAVAGVIAGTAVFRLAGGGAAGSGAAAGGPGRNVHGRALPGRAEGGGRGPRVLRAPGRGACTVTATADRRAARLTACVDYAAGPGGYVQVRRVSATFSAPAGYPAPFFRLVFRSARTGAVDDRLQSPPEPGGAVRSAGTGWLAPGGTAAGGTGATAFFLKSGGRFADGESLTVTLLTAGPRAAGPVPAAEVEVVLTDPGFGCAPGTASSSGPADC